MKLESGSSADHEGNGESAMVARPWTNAADADEWEDSR